MPTRFINVSVNSGDIQLQAKSKSGNMQVCNEFFIELTQKPNND